MEAKVLHIENATAFKAAVRAAADLLRAGEVVALPTETVYGLAANALDANAVRKIYDAKGRPAFNPIIVHIASLEMARACVKSWPATASQLATRFWPGPLTLVLPRARAIPPIVSAGGDTLGLRWPLHPFMREVIRECGFPIAAPSANLANQISPTSAQHVFQSLGDKIPLIVDAGFSNVGIESTVLDLTLDPPRVLRPGMISREELTLALGCEVLAGPAPSADLKSPGLLKKHYSPRAALIIQSWNNEAELLALARASKVPLDRIHVLAHEVTPRSGPYGRIAIIPHDAEAYARALYLELHQCDAMDAQLIIVEAPPREGAWAAIRDRLIRASVQSDAS